MRNGGRNFHKPARSLTHPTITRYRHPTSIIYHLSLLYTVPMDISRPIPTAITAALDTNVSLQSELQRLLVQIKWKKVINRRDAARVMMYCRNEGDHSLNISSATGDGAGASMLNSNDSLRLFADKNNSTSRKRDIDGTDALKIPTKFTVRKKSKLACNSSRKEMRRFFMDKEGTTPKSITWGTGRKQDIGRPAVIFERMQSRIAVEDEEPETMMWKKAKKCVWKDNSLEEVSMKITSSRLAENHLVPVFSFADPKMASAKFTKTECSFIKSMIQKMGGSIDWYNFAIKYRDKISQQSPWRCFCLFRSSTQNQTTWTSVEDELLLKYLAVQGPQYLLQGDCAVQTCRNLFPDRSTKQLILRAQSSLINPNYVQSSWGTNEKRKLALLVRAYSNEPNPINSVSRAVHFPHRASRSVAEKWINTLNPEMHHRFT